MPWKSNDKQEHRKLVRYHKDTILNTAVEALVKMIFESCLKNIDQRGQIESTFQAKGTFMGYVCEHKVSGVEEVSMWA